MYFLIKSTEIADNGGMDRRIEFIKKSQEKATLQKEVKDIFYKALDDEDVEFIDNYEKEEIEPEEWVETEDFLNLVIDCIPGGMNAVTEHYSIVSDDVPEV